MLFCKTIATNPPAPTMGLGLLGLLGLVAFLLAGCANPMGPPPDEYEFGFKFWFKKEDNDYSPEEWQECQNILEQLRSLGITKPERFESLEHAKYIVEQRLNLENKNIDPNKPVTIVMYPFADGNGAFTAKYNTLDTIINQPNQQLIYFEVTNDEALKSALRLAKDNLPEEKEIALILGGHGSADSLIWSNGSTNNFMDPTDYNDPEFTTLLRDLNIDLVIFSSCATGSTASSNNLNLADRIAEHISTDGKIFAPTVDVYNVEFIFNLNNEIEAVSYNAGEPEIIYQVNGTFSNQK